mgnify:CR=1 FL=1
MKKLLEISHLKKSFGDTEVLKDISMEVNEGEVVAILGPSGSGKSTLLRCATLLETMDAGTLKLGGETACEDKDGVSVYVGKKELREIKNTYVLVFQNFNLFPHYTVMKNVTDAPVCVQKRDKNEVEKEAKELLKKVGLDGKENSYPCQLSGGQQQRVAIARAIAAQPPVILADEPTGNLDSASSKEILQILKSMHEQGKTVILITHDNGIAAQARRVVRIMDGKIESDFINKNYGKEEYIKNQLDA